MTQTLISQIWKEYQVTGDKHLLADAVQYADFGNNKQIKDEICEKLMESAGKRSAYLQKIRDRGFFISHYLNITSGINASKSYEKICAENASDKYLNNIEEDALRKAIKNYKQPTMLVWDTKDYIIGNNEARYALALNGALLTKTQKEIKIEVSIKYPKNSLVELMPGIKVQEGLFWILQEKGWYHTGTIRWIHSTPSHD